MAYFIEDVLTDAKGSEFFPVSQTTFQDTDLIRFGNDALRMKIFPLIKRTQQHFYATHIVTSLKNNLAHYALPERSAANTLENLWFVPDYINKPNVRYQIRRREKSDISAWTISTGRPLEFYLEGDEIWLVPAPSSLSGNERLYWDYLERPSLLVPTTSCGKITAISTVSTLTTLTVDTDLTGSLTAGSKIDFLSATSPFRLWAKDVLIQSITSSSIVVNASDIQDESGTIEPVVSDYICQAQQANIPMMPQEFRPVLAEMICYRALKAMGATAKMQACADFIKDMIEGGVSLIESRVEDQVEVLRDRTGLMNSLGSFSGSNMVR